MHHRNPTPEQLAALAALDQDAPVLMLNLLRFREDAYPGSVADGMSGLAAYREYQRRVAGLGDVFTGEVVVAGDRGPTVIGPDHEQWDEMLVVRYPSLRAFFLMLQDPGYQEVARYRTAAVADSRLVAFSAQS